MMRAGLIVFCLALLVSAAASAQDAPDPAAAPEAQDAPSYEIRLRTLQERVDDLKSRVFDSKSKLLVLREQILRNLISEARSTIVHVNEASNSLVLEEVVYFLDNEKIYFQSNRDGVLEQQREFEVFAGSIAPGNHIISVEMAFRGKGNVFSYVSGYAFRVRSSFSFFAGKGQDTRVRAVAYEKGGMAARLEDRPSVRFELSHQKVTEDPYVDPASSDGRR